MNRRFLVQSEYTDFFESPRIWCWSGSSQRNASKLYRCIPPKRVWFFSCFGLNIGQTFPLHATGLKHKNCLISSSSTCILFQLRSFKDNANKRFYGFWVEKKNAFYKDALRSSPWWWGAGNPTRIFFFNFFIRGGTDPRFKPLPFQFWQKKYWYCNSFEFGLGQWIVRLRPLWLARVIFLALILWYAIDWKLL